MDNLRITLTSQRKLLAIESDNFRIKLNGKTNADYAAAFKVFGITLVFENEAGDIAANSDVDPNHETIIAQRENRNEFA